MNEFCARVAVHERCGDARMTGLLHRKVLVPLKGKELKRCGGGGGLGGWLRKPYALVQGWLESFQNVRVPVLTTRWRVVWRQLRGRLQGEKSCSMPVKCGWGASLRSRA